MSTKPALTDLDPDILRIAKFLNKKFGARMTAYQGVSPTTKKVTEYGEFTNNTAPARPINSTAGEQRDKAGRLIKRPS